MRWRLSHVSELLEQRDLTYVLRAHERASARASLLTHTHPVST